ncbi:molybdopterin molybdotransferase MoeA [Undibacterium luofuense]|uniref:Molybdopterin molybdenumtransferase n=1 Tax=Undibacterium luofuense TaxID=2828733 RepID=A0A941I6B5_9BURK|nr:gephyrin-like molybdotransferase Glp [Undibacterium luofuense]MBR7781659.1 molybdopterin molybdotransferase MoeA [Undibacterium luofuense]
MQTIEQTRNALQQLAAPALQTESLPLLQAVGRIAAEPVVAAFDMPAFDNSAMDGFAIAFHADSANTAFHLIGTVFAGDAQSMHLQPGQAARVFTGARLPANTSAVVMQEQCEWTDRTLQIQQLPPAGQHMRRAGSELAKGSDILQRGQIISPLQTGLLASLGVAALTVYRKLRVAVLSSGNELCEPGQALSSGQIYDANRPQLLALLQACGFEAIDAGIVRDDPTQIDARLRASLLQADVLITSGGASVGEADWMRDVIAGLGQLHQWKVSIKPGKPFGFGTVLGKPVLMLPGNPVSALVTLWMIAMPWLRRCAGASDAALPQRRVRLSAAVSNHDQRPHLMRSTLECTEQGWLATVSAQQGSGALSSLAQADCLVEVPPQTSFSAGDTAIAWLLPQTGTQLL